MSKNNSVLFSGALFFALLIVAALIFSSGCTENTAAGAEKSTFSVTENGVLVPGEISYLYSSGNITNEGSEGDVTVSEIWMKDGSKDVYALLAAPQNPVAGVVFAPGAGVSADSHKDRAIGYAQEGIAFLAVDIRGNGGRTSGTGFNLQNEYATISAGKTPQYYSIIFDLIAAKEYLKDAYGSDLPVYIMGSSNGGRYATVAAGIDPEFAGFIGVSTSGYVYEEGINGEAVDLFIRSINPEAYISDISPSPVVIFHAPGDDIIEFDSGMALFNKASEPKDFVAFNGTHGINSEVDEYVLNMMVKTKA